MGVDGDEWGWEHGLVKAKDKVIFILLFVIPRASIVLWGRLPN